MRRFAALAMLLALTGCVAPPAPPPTAPTAAIVARPHLFYVGLGMGGETWSEQDVVDAGRRLAEVATGFDMVPLVFSNRVPGGSDRFPPVDDDAVTSAIGEIAARSDAEDVVLVYVSTHGAPGLLGQAADGQQLPPVGVAQFRRWLAPLAGRDTVLILSACFSGSFIPALRGEHRVVFTAARADRTSFGCQPGADHTVFGQALLRSLAPDESLHELVDRTRDAVRDDEAAMGFCPPSMPQVAVGSAARRLYEAPLF